MAEPWIKMRTNLATSPKVVRISSALKADRLRVIGGLHSAWSLFDQHSEDGILIGYSPETLDELIGWPGFTAAMIAVEWAFYDGESLALPRYEDHNGQSAKRRAMDADRKKNVRKVSASEADKKRTRGEENRGDRKDISDDPSDHPRPPASPADPPVDPPAGDKPTKPDPVLRLAQVTDEATEAYNAICAKPHGLMPKAAAAGREARKGHVKRVVALAKAICAEQYRTDHITPEFWRDYCTAVQADEFHSGRQGGGNGHDGWTPDFEYITQRKTMLRVYERAGDEA